MGAAGSPYAAFRRALDRRNLTLALAEARDLPVVGLADALELPHEAGRRGRARFPALSVFAAPAAGAILRRR